MPAPQSPPGFGATGGPWWRWWRAALFLAMASIGALYALYFVRYLDYPGVDRAWTLDYVVHNAWQMVHGQPVYVDPMLGEPTAFLYTPGLTLMLVPLVALFGPELWPARLLNMLAAALLVLIVTRETARRVRDRRLVWFAPGLVFLMGSANYRELLAVHPENWALAFALLGIVAARRAGETGRAPVWAVLAACAAVATKQTTLLYVPVAAVVLAAHGRLRAAVGYLAGVATLLTLGTVWGQLATDGQFLDYMLLALQQGMIWSKLPSLFVYFGYYFTPYVLVLVAAALVGGRRRSLTELARDPFLTALAVAVPATIYVMAKGGSVANNLLGVSMLLVPLLLEAVESLRPWLARRPAAAATAALAALLWTGYRTWHELPPLWNQIDDRDRGAQLMHRLDQVIQQAEGPVWVPLDLSLPLRNGVPVRFPGIVLAEYKFTEGVFDPVLAELEARAFDTILLPNGFSVYMPDELFGPVLRRNYRAVELIGDELSVGSFTEITVLKRKEG